jgi:hypothetical protein
MKDIYVVEHPRSGATWLQRLLSDILKANLISAFNYPGEYTPQYWGEGEPENIYRIFKSHSKTRQGTSIFVYRDPRDMFVSAWHYNNRGMSLYEKIERYLTQEYYNPDADSYGRYQTFMGIWYRTGLAEAMVKYEDLHLDPLKHLFRVIVLATGERISVQDINNAYFRHERSHELNLHPELAHSMWKGQIGTWREYFTQREADLVQYYLGDMMLDIGYIDGPEWVHEVQM